MAALSNTPEQIAIALDIGGTNIKACFRARGSELLTWLEKIPTNTAFTDKTTNTEAVAAVCARLQCQLQAKGLHLCHATKLAISFAGPVDLKTGHVLKAYNLGGERHEGDLAAEFRNHLISTYILPCLSGDIPLMPSSEQSCPSTRTFPFFACPLAHLWACLPFTRPLMVRSKSFSPKPGATPSSPRAPATRAFGKL